MAQQRLTAQQKRWVVEQLARYEGPPSIVAARFREEFGREITRQTVMRYDPGTRTGASLSPLLRKVFEDTRATFTKSLADCALAQQVVRLKRLDRLAMKAEAAGAFDVAGDIIAIAARDMGGSYTNKNAVRVDTFVARKLSDFYGEGKSAQDLAQQYADTIGGGPDGMRRH